MIAPLVSSNRPAIFNLTPATGSTAQSADNSAQQPVIASASIPLKNVLDNYRTQLNSLLSPTAQSRIDISQLTLLFRAWASPLQSYLSSAGSQNLETLTQSIVTFFDEIGTSLNSSQQTLFFNLLYEQLGTALPTVVNALKARQQPSETATTQPLTADLAQPRKTFSAAYPTPQKIAPAFLKELLPILNLGLEHADPDQIMVSVHNTSLTEKGILATLQLEAKPSSVVQILGNLLGAHGEASIKTQSLTDTLLQHFSQAKISSGASIQYDENAAPGETVTALLFGGRIIDPAPLVQALKTLDYKALYQKVVNRYWAENGLQLSAPENSPLVDLSSIKEFKDLYRAVANRFWAENAAALVSGQQQLMRSAIQQQKADGTLSETSAQFLSQKILNGSGLDVHLLNIHGYTATDILIFTIAGQATTVLYAAGEKPAFKEFNHAEELKSWVASALLLETLETSSSNAALRHAAEQELQRLQPVQSSSALPLVAAQLLRHFSRDDQMDGLTRTGLKEALRLIDSNILNQVAYIGPLPTPVNLIRPAGPTAAAEALARRKIAIELPLLEDPENKKPITEMLAQRQKNRLLADSTLAIVSDNDVERHRWHEWLSYLELLEIPLIIVAPEVGLPLLAATIGSNMAIDAYQANHAGSAKERSEATSEFNGEAINLVITAVTEGASRIIGSAIRGVGNAIKQETAASERTVLETVTEKARKIDQPVPAEITTASGKATARQTITAESAPAMPGNSAAPLKKTASAEVAVPSEGSAARIMGNGRVTKTDRLALALQGLESTVSLAKLSQDADGIYWLEGKSYIAIEGKAYAVRREWPFWVVHATANPTFLGKNKVLLRFKAGQWELTKPLGLKGGVNPPKTASPVPQSEIPETSSRVGDTQPVNARPSQETASTQQLSSEEQTTQQNTQNLADEHLANIHPFLSSLSPKVQLQIESLAKTTLIPAVAVFENVAEYRRLIEQYINGVTHILFSENLGLEMGLEMVYMSAFPGSSLAQAREATKDLRQLISALPRDPESKLANVYQRRLKQILSTADKQTRAGWYDQWVEDLNAMTQPVSSIALNARDLADENLINLDRLFNLLSPEVQSEIQRTLIPELSGVAKTAEYTKLINQYIDDFIAIVFRENLELEAVYMAACPDCSLEEAQQAAANIKSTLDQRLQNPEVQLFRAPGSRLANSFRTRLSALLSTPDVQLRKNMYAQWLSDLNVMTTPRSDTVLQLAPIACSSDKPLAGTKPPIAEAASSSSQSSDSQRRPYPASGPSSAQWPQKRRLPIEQDLSEPGIALTIADLLKSKPVAAPFSEEPVPSFSGSAPQRPSVPHVDPKARGKISRLILDTQKAFQRQTTEIDRLLSRLDALSLSGDARQQLLDYRQPLLGDEYAAASPARKAELDEAYINQVLNKLSDEQQELETMLLVHRPQERGEAVRSQVASLKSRMMYKVYQNPTARQQLKESYQKALKGVLSADNAEGKQAFSNQFWRELNRLTTSLSNNA